MGQTFTHGVYLPDEGERNCYNGLASNWSILDGAVGTIAEHTSQIAGKAPAVHTHTKSDITDFPAYGNAAGTICEGNDSRLSDARTPVAHTHTKSDITDLFNSANTWSEEQIFSSGMQLKGDRSAYIYPMWGGGGAASGIAFLVIDGSKQFVFGQRTTDANNRYRYDTTKGYLVIKTGEKNGTNFVEVAPSGTDIKLGTSTNKWKTFNGVNPGALSLPIRGYNDSIALDTTNWVYDGTVFSISMEMPGWVVIVAEGVDASDFIKIRFTTYTRSPGLDFVAVNIAGSYSIKACFPITDIMCLCLKLTNGVSSIKYARYYPCLGNV